MTHWFRFPTWLAYKCQWKTREPRGPVHWARGATVCQMLRGLR
jgi:hypothetical protein